MIIREINMEQLIIIVQKNNLRMECIFRVIFLFQDRTQLSKDIKVCYLISMRD